MISTLHIWAFRDVLQRPFEALLLAISLIATTALLGTTLLLPRALYDTVSTVFTTAPSIVIRQVNAAGWQPLHIKEALQAVHGIIGVVEARPRVWSVVNGPEGPLTVVGIASESLPEKISPYLTQLPQPGEAVLGPGVDPERHKELLYLEAAIRKEYRVVARLPTETGLFAHDLVFLNFADAQELIGIPGGYASDLAIDVFHENEESAILADLTTAFPWPVHCVTKHQSSGIYTDALNRRNMIGTIVFIPSILAVCLFVTANARKSTGPNFKLGIMRATGWAMADIVRFQIYRILFVCLPAMSIGLCASFFMVYWPGMTWTGRILFGWDTVSPALTLRPEATVLVVLEVVGLVLVPVLASTLISALKGISTDIYSLIQEV